ncbi:MAG: FHA domain-containing protein [Tepidisphaeraceae bacterium]
MPFIVVNSDRQDVDCRELTGALIIGRAPDCQLAVRDILLSRRHCRIEKSPHGWLLIDLNSKNGTAVNGEKLIAPRLLRDNDIVRMGRSRLVFRAGEPEEGELRTPCQRPVDPTEALAGTLAGFTLTEPGEFQPPPHMPAPQPKPKEPAAFQREELHEMLTAIASSSWDSIYAEARQPLRRPSGQSSSTATLERSRTRPMRPRSPIDLSLQASPTPMTKTARAVESPNHRPPIAVISTGILLATGIMSIGLWPAPAQPPALKEQSISSMDQVAWTDVAATAVAHLPLVSW